MPGVPLITNSIRSSVLTRSRDDFGASTSRTVGAVFEDAVWHNPTTAIVRMNDLENLAENTEGKSGVFEEVDFYDGRPGRLWDEAAKQKEEAAFLERQSGTGAWINRDSAIELIKSRGYAESDISISKIGANSFVLNEILRRKDEERKRQDIITRGSNGRAGITLAAGFAGSATDPLGLAASFIPVVGQARYASALQAAGGSMLRRTMVRARYGAIEGAVGNAIIEPFAGVAAGQDATDYTIDDTFSNIAFGAVFGTGMHMGIGYMGDRIRLGMGLALDVGPQGKMPEALSELPQDLIKGNLQEALNAASQGRNIRVQEYMQLFDVELRPGERMKLPNDMFLDIDETGKVGLFSMDEIPVTLDKVMAREDLPKAIRDLAEKSADMDEFARRLEKKIEGGEQIDRRNVRDLQKVLTKEESMPLSTFLESKGGITLDRSIAHTDSLGIKEKNRPKLFKDEGGMTVPEAMAAAKEAGYTLKQFGNHTSTKKFLEQLRDDISGKKRILKTVAEEKLTALAEEVGDIADAESFRQAAVRDGLGPAERGASLVGYSEKYQAPENLRSFQSGRADEIAAIMEKPDLDTRPELINNDFEAVDAVMRDIEEDLGIKNTDYRTELETIKKQSDDEVKKMDALITCMLGSI